MKNRRGIITNAIVPLRAEPDDRSEMESQLLFGETFEILDRQNQWLRVRNDYDRYEGWIDEKTFVPAHKTNGRTGHYVSAPHAVIRLPDVTLMHLTAGAFLPGYNPGAKSFQIEDLNFQLENGKTVTGKQNLDFLLQLAGTYLNAPYLWGGMTPFGIDCSGFTQMLFKISGLYRLSRNASQQAHEGVLVDFKDRQPGDLAFFVNPAGKIHHVGLVWPDGKIMHAHGQVRIDRLDVDGIFNEEKQELTHYLAAIKRIIQ